MILSILTDKENKLLDRKEIEAEIEFSGKTPANDEVKKELAKRLKVDENLIVIKHIYQEFGNQKARLIANVYKSLDCLKNLEVKEVTKKMAEEEEKQEAPQEEAPVEEEPKEEAEEEPAEEEPAEEEPKEEAEEEPAEEEKEEEAEEKEE